MTYTEKTNELIKLVNTDFPLVAFLKTRAYIIDSVKLGLLEELVSPEFIQETEEEDFENVVNKFKEGLKARILSEVEALFPVIEPKPKVSKKSQETPLPE